MAASARQVAICNTAFGALAVAIGVMGFRRGPRWASLLGWMIAALLAMLGVDYVFAGENVAVLGIFFGGALLCAVGLLLAHRPATETRGHAQASLER